MTLGTKARVLREHGIICSLTRDKLFAEDAFSTVTPAGETIFHSQTVDVTTMSNRALWAWLGY